MRKKAVKVKAPMIRDEIKAIYNAGLKAVIKLITTKEPGQGTGLGLATVQSIVANHGGFITVESKPGRGTNFKIYLPAHEAASQKQAEEGHPNIPFGKDELILVVDDEAAVREMTRTTLEAFGYRALTADDGRPRSPSSPLTNTRSEL